MLIDREIYDMYRNVKYTKMKTVLGLFYMKLDIKDTMMLLEVKPSFYFLLSSFVRYVSILIIFKIKFVFQQLHRHVVILGQELNHPLHSMSVLPY